VIVLEIVFVIVIAMVIVFDIAAVKAGYQATVDPAA
jgi:hypothetical protein